MKVTAWFKDESFEEHEIADNIARHLSPAQAIEKIKARIGEEKAEQVKEWEVEEDFL